MHVVEANLAVLGVLKDEEDQDGRDSNAGIEGSGQNVVVLGPPREMTPADNVLEDESNDGPGNVVDGARRGDVTSTREDYGEVKVAQPAVRELQAEEVGEDRCGKADQEEEEESVVDLSLGELASRTNDTPDDTGSTEYFCRWANESVLLSWITHVGNVGEHPRLDTELDGASNNSGDDLGPEHSPRRNLHVVAKLEIGGKGQGLGHCDVSPSLEHHHGDGAAREGITDDELSDDVETDLLVSNGLDHADRDNIDERDNQGKDEVLNGEFGFPNLDGDNTKREHGQEDCSVPPFRYLGVAGHKAGVDIGLLIHGTASMCIDLFAEIEEGVRECSRD